MSRTDTRKITADDLTSYKPGNILVVPGAAGGHRDHVYLRTCLRSIISAAKADGRVLAQAVAS